MKKLFSLLILLQFIFLSSCALLTSGFKQNVKIDSDPQGAKINVDGEILGTTPSQVKIKRNVNDAFNGGKEVLLIKEGYETQSFYINPEFNAIAILNFVNPLFWAIDLGTGAVIKYDDYSRFILTQKGSSGRSAIVNLKGDKYDKLRKLKSLLEDGVITQEEFEAEKKRLLEENEGEGEN